MLTEPHSLDLPTGARRHKRARLLPVWLLAGTALLLNGYLATLLYPDNVLASELSAVVGSVLLALPILGVAVRDLARGGVRMNGLVALAVLASFAQNDYRTAGIVSFFMLTAMLIETRTAEGAHASIESLIRLSPVRATRLLPDNTEVDVAAGELSPGDRVRIRPGQVVPADGVIVDGQTTLNEATITGESLPVDKHVNDDVFAGTHNMTGMLELRVTHVGEETTLGQVRELILAAEQSRLPILRIADRYVHYYTPIILMIAALVWLLSHELSRVISLLVVACPCALVLATPTAMVAALAAAARSGILVKDIADLEGASRLNAFVFDKTGTLTTGELTVTKLVPAAGIESEELLHVAASGEQFSNHPVALAIRSLAEQAGVQTATASHFSEEAGHGVRARVQDQRVLAGRADWLGQNGFDAAHITDDAPDDAAGGTRVYVAHGDRYLGWIGLEDGIRDGCRTALDELRALGIGRLAMITGDRTAVAQRVAQEIGCTEIAPECLPDQKVAFVRELREEGFKVGVVGDGVNDAPALAAGDTGIAMGAAGSDVAIHSATIALMSNDLRRLPFLVRLSRRARHVVYQNLTIGLAFILGGLALAGLGMLNPIVAAILHNAGSLIVVFNSARLFRAGDYLEEAGTQKSEVRGQRSGPAAPVETRATPRLSLRSSAVTGRPHAGNAPSLVAPSKETGEPSA